MSIRQALNQLNQIIKVRAAMPGHKGRLSLDAGHDVTELPGADNLHKPTGVIRAAQERAAAIYGTASARYLVNGSSCGNLSLIFSFFHEGDEVLVERACHRSVYNGLLLRKLRPQYLWPRLDEFANSLPQSPEQVCAALRANPGIKGVILTQPSYKGQVSDIEEIYRICWERGVFLLVDAAHGAALRGMPDFLNFYRSCDAMVISAHKSLNCLNQGALLLNNRPEFDAALMRYSSMFQTTSPSYLIMESMEDSLEELAGGRYLNAPRFQTTWQRLIINPAEPGIRRDPWKLLVIARGRGAFMERFLEARGIYPECHDVHSVLLMLSPANLPADLVLIREGLAELDEYLLAMPEAERGSLPEAPPAPHRALQPYEIGDSYEERPLGQCVGAIAQEQVTPYPPGVPLLLPGERIDEAMAGYLERLLEENVAIIGVYDGKLRCLKEAH